VASDVSCQEDVLADEALLRKASAAVRVAILCDRSLSVGVGVPSGVTYLRRARDEGIPVVRRSTGGTGVLHGPGDLAWSVVLPRGHPLVGPDYVHGYERLGQGVAEFLRSPHRSVRWVPAPGVSEDCCLLGSRGRVLTVDGRILGGAAQHASRSALLHHGILPYRLDRPTLARVFDLGVPSPTDRLIGLADLDQDRPRAAMARELGTTIAEGIARAEASGRT
jgi:lipoate-protein ligase A